MQATHQLFLGQTLLGINVTILWSAPVHLQFAYNSSYCQPQLLEKKRKDYAFRRQFSEKPSIIPGCPGPQLLLQLLVVSVTERWICPSFCQRYGSC